jgi:hypothetical protein
VSANLLCASLNPPHGPGIMDAANRGAAEALRLSLAGGLSKACFTQRLFE